MKTKLIIALIIAAGLIFIGIAVAACGFAMSGFDIKNLTTDPEVTNYMTIDQDFNSIIIDATTADLKILPSTDGKCKIDLVERENLYFMPSVENGILTINEIDDRKWYEYIGIGWSNMSITLYLPKEQYDSLTVELTTGRAQIDSGLEFGKVDIKATTGSVKCEAKVTESLAIKCTTGLIYASGADVDTIKLKASTGSIELCNSSCKTLEVEATTGSIKLSEVSGTGDFDIEATTGKINLSDVVTEGDLTIEADTGDVIFKRCDAANLSITTDTGDIEGSLLSSKVFFYETDTGDVELPRTDEGGKCNIETDTGDITVTIVGVGISK
ncbi:MAG: DUF4097 family beta strand repeat protein [Clostridia bacterium]|nr:DUF4097 family beta strand repeat protein [Clostridia bacterium]